MSRTVEALGGDLPHFHCGGVKKASVAEVCWRQLTQLVQRESLKQRPQMSGALDENRTRDLFFTKEVLCR